MATDISKAVLEEVEDCIRRVADFHEANGRAIAKHIRKRTRKGRAELEELAQFGLPLPDDLRALYWNHNGTGQGTSIPMSATGVFLEFRWLPARTFVGTNKVMRVRKEVQVHDRVQIFSGAKGLDLDLAPKLAFGKQIPLMVSLGPLSLKTFHAFDSILSMLRSVCAAQDAGILRFEGDTVHYVFAEFRDVARAFNINTEYWDLMAAGTLDWEEIHYDFSNGQHGITPEVARIITEPLQRAAEDFKHARYKGPDVMDATGKAVLKKGSIGKISHFLDENTAFLKTKSGFEGPVPMQMLDYVM